MLWLEPANLFLIVMRHLAWFVSKRSGVRFSSLVLWASILRVCHINSLKISNCPLSGSFTLVVLKSECCHIGDFDSTRMRFI